LFMISVQNRLLLLSGNKDSFMKNYLFVFLVLGFAFTAQAQKDSISRKSVVMTVKDGKEYIIHTVIKGQTLYSISKIYKVAVEDIEKENPDVKNGLKPSMEILIPTGKLIKQGNPTGNQQTQFIEHTVKKQETLYGISKQYGISVDELMNLNPDIKKGLKTGMVMRIPQKKKDSVIKKEIPEIKKNEDTIKQNDEIIKVKQKDQYNVALMVPFYLNEASAINISDHYEWKDLTQLKSMTFIQFYEGFLMSVDSLTEKGLNMHLWVYDVTEDTTSLKNILAKPEMKQMDLIIGPVFGNCFRLASTYAKKNQIPIVNPFSSRAGIVKNNPYVFKLTPSDNFQYEHLVTYMTDSISQANILFVKNSAQDNLAEKTFSDIFNRQASLKNISVSYLKPGVCKSYEIECIRKKLSDERPNIIMALFEGEAPVSNFVRNMNELEGYDIRLFGLPSWNNYENVEIEYMQKLKLHLYEPNFIDYNEPAVKHFIIQFRTIYKTEPGLYAFCGFDIATYFLSALRDYGTEFYKHCSEMNFTGLETTFNFVQTNPASGFENDYINIYRYENYRLSDVKKKQLPMPKEKE
jgi:LysM repeat protein/ABC-type branched-subunit amino acid transport system substrate-binding protein